MKRRLLTGVGILFFTWMIAYPAPCDSITRITRIRYGRHNGYDRLVLDLAGPKPSAIGPATDKFLPIFFHRIEISGDQVRMFGPKGDAVADLRIGEEIGKSVITAEFGRPGMVAKYFYLDGDENQTPSNGLGYRLVVDFYFEDAAPAGPGKLITHEMAVTIKAASKNAADKSTGPLPAPVAGPIQPTAASQRPGLPGSGPAPPATTTSKVSTTETPQPKQTPQEASESESPSEAADTGAEIEAEQPAEEEPEGEAAHWSGEIGLTFEALSDGATSSLAAAYRDDNPVTGDLALSYNARERYYFTFEGRHIGRDDQIYDITGGRYGWFDIEAGYQERPHRLAFDSRTLYSGVGSTSLTLDDSLQSAVQNLAGDPVAQANLLSGAVTAADTGNPAILRRKQNLSIHLPAIKPLNFRVDLGMETQNGTRPRFGSFGMANTVELFEPIDSKTLNFRFIAEYANKNLLLNGEYYFQAFDNNLDFLSFDNPFQLNDSFGGPSRGRIALAPDNLYHGVNLSAAYGNLPLHSRISTTAGFGWMTQDARLTAFTDNSALASPFDYTDPANLPQDSAGARVDTTLFRVALTSRPASFMSLKFGYHYDNYDNHSDILTFPQGYISADSMPVTAGPSSLITTLPVSFRRIKTDVDLGFQLTDSTRLNLSYVDKSTDRTNSETAHQTEHIFGGSLDTHPARWIDIRFAYDHTRNDIDDYNSQIYLNGGLDLNELPGLRKYNQADADKDRVRLTTTVYPTAATTFSGNAIFGRDDYSDSPYGLIQSDYFATGVDADWILLERLTLHGYYNYEVYTNKQQGRGYFDTNGDGLQTETDWGASGTDRVQTLGLNIGYPIIPDRFLFNLSYAFSIADGSIDFVVPFGTVGGFDQVDDAVLHTVDGSLTLHFLKQYRLKVGCLWERFQYHDYNQDSFTPVPVDSSGAYNGAILSDTIPKDYDAFIMYAILSFRF